MLSRLGCVLSHLEWQDWQKNFLLLFRHASMERLVCLVDVPQPEHLKFLFFGLRLGENMLNKKRIIIPAIAKPSIFSKVMFSVPNVAIQR